MTGLVAFKRLLPGILEAEQIEQLRQDGATVQLFVGQRPIRVSLNERGALHIATMVFYNDSRADRVLDKQLAAFNAQYLFRGGYCLVVEPDSLSIHLEQIVDPARFDPESFGVYLVDFASRAASCAGWYKGLSKERA